MNICKKRGVLFGKSVNISCSIELKTIRGMYYNLKPYQMDEYTYIDTLGSIQDTEMYVNIYAKIDRRELRCI